MEKEILNIQYNHSCLIIKAVNSSTSIDEAAIKLGISKWVLYGLIRMYHLKMKKGSCYINPQKIKFKNLNGVYLEADPI